MIDAHAIIDDGNIVKLKSVWERKNGREKKNYLSEPRRKRERKNNVKESVNYRIARTRSGLGTINLTQPLDGLTEAREAKKILLSERERKKSISFHVKAKFSLSLLLTYEGLKLNKTTKNRF